MKSCLLIVFLALGLIGCANNQLNVLAPNPTTGKFETSTIFGPSEIKTYIPIDNYHSQKFIVVDSFVDLQTWQEDYKPYIYGMLKNSGMDNFATMADLENIVIANNLGREISTVRNRIGLNQLSKYIGPFLYLSADLDYLGNDSFNFVVTIYDPITSSVKFYGQKAAIGWVGIDGPILTPMFNEVKRWVEDSKKLSKKNKENTGREIGT